MTKVKPILLILLLNLCYSKINASNDENEIIDSLKEVIKSTNADTIKIKALVEWDNLIYYKDIELDLELNNKIIQISSKRLKSKIEKKEKKFLETKLAASYNNLGIIYEDKGNYPFAIEHYYKALRIFDKLDDKRGKANAYNNIGVINRIQLRYDLSEKNLNDALILFKEIDDKRGIALGLHNLGNLCWDKKEATEALNYYKKSLEIREEIKDLKAISDSKGSIGNVYYQLNDFKNAIIYYEGAIEISRKINDVYAIAGSSINLATCNFRLNQLSLAKKQFIEGIEIAEKYKIKILLKIGYKGLSRIDSASNNYKAAYEHYKLFTKFKDSLLNEENTRKNVQIQMQYEFDKKSTADSIEFATQQKLKDIEIEKKNAEATLKDAELEKKRTEQYALYGGLAFVLLFLIFVYNRFKVTQRQKAIIEKQKSEVEQQKMVVELAHDELEEKNNEILASINYAKRIQTAILPPQKIVKEYLEESFILYKPKDIVAGDFYWLEHKNDWVFFAAADCTGHGVPGAMVSVICNNGLNRSVREYGITEPGLILDRTREIVIAEFEKSDEEVKDGMDISLCALSIKQLKLKWAGANNPLWIIRNGEVIEYKPNKQPIGKYSDPELFLTHEIDLLKGDSIYVFTDGYQDQFGGEKGKKFRASRMKELLLSIEGLNMSEQKNILDREIELWKGKLEQVDDICIVGVKI